ncbi:MAG: hypothetical protein HY819_23690 [Acidobacteria bacterium]|nr:hypothetical protein [Acidobacteriota bacterium]
MYLEKIKKAIFNFLKFIGVSLVLIVLYICFVPPFGEIPRAERLRLKKLEPIENALTEYDLALKDLESVTQQTHPTIGSEMEKAARGVIAVDEKLSTFLQNHQVALSHLKEAAKRSQYQFYDHSPIFSDPAPGYLESNKLFNLAGLQARVFIDKGELAKASEINLAIYKMASNFSIEPNGSLIFSLISEVSKGKALGNLFYLLLQKDPSKDTLIEIASQIEKIDSKLPDPYEVMLREWKMTQLSLDVALVEEKEGFEINNKRMDYLPSALKLRLYQSYMQKTQNYTLLLATPLRQWDFEGVKVAQELSMELSESLLDKEWIDFTGLFQLSNFANANSAMTTIYIGRANSAALRAFAICSAYQKVHGKFPETLSQAFDELGAKAGLTIPLDPITGQAIGYRLENGKPVVWLVGKDGQDDGGVKSYSMQDFYKGNKGVDLVFFYGELPPWFKPKVN